MKIFINLLYIFTLFYQNNNSTSSTFPVLDCLFLFGHNNYSKIQISNISQLLQTCFYMLATGIITQSY